jgi:hypothetical protein
MSMVFIDQLQDVPDRYGYTQPDFEATHPISVYWKVSEIMGGLITTNRVSLQWALPMWKSPSHG